MRADPLNKTTAYSEKSIFSQFTIFFTKKISTKADYGRKLFYSHSTRSKTLGMAKLYHISQENKSNRAGAELNAKESSRCGTTVDLK